MAESDRCSPLGSREIVSGNGLSAEMSYVNNLKRLWTRLVGLPLVEITAVFDEAGQAIVPTGRKWLATGNPSERQQSRPRTSLYIYGRVGEQQVVVSVSDAPGFPEAGRLSSKDADALRLTGLELDVSPIVKWKPLEGRALLMMEDAPGLDEDGK